MPWLKVLRGVVGALVAMLLVTACASPASMTPLQKDAYDLRRFCEQNPNDVAKCLGYLGDH
jgi:outer membrane biogenesis lipoprotein LolB